MALQQLKTIITMCNDRSFFFFFFFFFVFWAKDRSFFFDLQTWTESRFWRKLLTGALFQIIQQNKRRCCYFSGISILILPKPEYWIRIVSSYQLHLCHQSFFGRHSILTTSMADIADALNLRKYGVPFYGVGWVPYKYIRSSIKKEEQVEGEEQSPSGDYIVLAGGGGEGRSGIPNAILIAQFDSASNNLSQDPVVKHGMGSDLPYRMAVHPQGDGVVCALPNGCRLFDWHEADTSELHKLGIKPSEQVLIQLEDVGQQLALVFNKDGSALAAGGEDGKLRIFKWPSMEIILEESEAHSSVKDLDFSPDGKILVSLGNSGPCRVWDVTLPKTIASLSPQKGERFGYCRFCQLTDGTQVLYITAVTAEGGYILTWNTTTWTRISAQKVSNESINAFNVSNDGKLLAIGTGDGDVSILRSSGLKKLTTIKKAHLGFVTALAFAPDSRALVSVSMDSSARVTAVDDKMSDGIGGRGQLYLFILMALIAYALYYYLEKSKRLVLQ